MSDSEKIATWSGITTTYGFAVDVYEDREQGLYRAHIVASKSSNEPTLRLPRRAARRLAMEHVQPPLEDTDLEILEGRTKVTVTQRFGAILQFKKREP